MAKVVSEPVLNVPAGIKTIFLNLSGVVREVTFARPIIGANKRSNSKVKIVEMSFSNMMLDRIHTKIGHFIFLPIAGCDIFKHSY